LLGKSRNNKTIPAANGGFAFLRVKSAPCQSGKILVYARVEHRRHLLDRTVPLRQAPLAAVA
jgi:hypothetical protein